MTIKTVPSEYDNYIKKVKIVSRKHVVVVKNT